METIKLDFSGMKTGEDLHRYLKDEMLFSEHYGANLDALYDALTEITEDTVVELIAVPSGHGPFEGYLENALGVFKDAAKENKHLILKNCLSS